MELATQSTTDAPPRPRASAQVDVTPFEDGFMVYDRGNDKVHVLNRSAGEVLQLCSGERTAADIAMELQRSYHLDAPPEDEVEKILKQMREAGLITGLNPAPATA